MQGAAQKASGDQCREWTKMSERIVFDDRPLEVGDILRAPSGLFRVVRRVSYGSTERKNWVYFSIVTALGLVGGTRFTTTAI